MNNSLFLGIFRNTTITVEDFESERNFEKKSVDSFAKKRKRYIHCKKTRTQIHIFVKKLVSDTVIFLTDINKLLTKNKNTIQFKFPLTIKNIVEYSINFINELQLLIAWFCSSSFFFRKVEIILKDKDYDHIRQRRNGINNCNHKSDWSCVGVCFDFGKRTQKREVSFFELLPIIKPLLF